LPVRIEGEVKYALSTSSARPLEDVDLKVYRVDGQVSTFNLHIGETSEVFAFDVAGKNTTQANTQEAVAAGTESEKSLVAVVYRKFRLPSFAFGFDEWSLADEGKRALSEIVEELRKEKGAFIVRIDGYTDDIGSAEYNYDLGLRRAVAAATYLVSNTGFDPALLFVKSVGETAPVATNESEDGRLQNRRIELLVLVPKEGT
jgi:outer membrane protein OmpA-like peptidoglycan-associated protein